MFFQLSKFNCVSETNQTCNQNFPTPFFRERCQEDIAICYTAQIRPETNLIIEPLYFEKKRAILGKP